MLAYLYVGFWILFFVCGLLYFYKYGLSHLYDYRIGERGVEFFLFVTFHIFTIKFSSIESVRKIRIFTPIDNTLSSIFLSLVIGNRMITQLVVLKMKVGPFRFIALTPKDPELFLRQLKVRMGEI